MRRFVRSVLLITFLSILFLIQSTYAYDNIEYGFSITPPTMWNVVEDTGTPIIVIGFVKSDSSASINVAFIDGSGTLTLSDIRENVVDYLPDFFGDSNLVYEATRVIGGLECYEIEYTTGSGTFAMMKIRQVIFVENGNEYVITYGALESEFANYRSDAENSIESFRIAPAQNTISNNQFIIPAVIGVVVAVVVAIILLLRKKRRPESTIGTDVSLSSSQFGGVQVTMGTALKHCRFCGVEIKNDTVYCEDCGKRLVDG